MVIKGHPKCRRLLHDDGRGVAEALNETICALEKCMGLTDGDKFTKFQVPTFTGIYPSYSQPYNVAIITL
ncbi:hypothetical protein P3L10_004521 [Capsicum annuum]